MGNSEALNVAGTGAYSSYVQRTNNPGNAAATTFGNTSNGTLASPAQMDTFTVSATAGDRMLARMVNTGGSSSYYPDVQVYRPDGTKACSDYANNYHYDELQACSLDQTGTYTVVAGNSESTNVAGTGNYSFYLQRTNNPGNAAATTFGNTSNGTLASPAQMDTFTVSATAGDRLLVRMINPSGSNSYYPDLQVYRPDGTMDCADTPIWYRYLELQACLLDQTGTFTIVAGNWQSSTVPGTGDYSFYLQRTNNPGGATATTFGNTSNGTLASPAQMDTFTVSATAGDRLLVRMINTGGSNSYYPDLQVYRPDGTKDCADAGITYHYLELQACLLDQAGTYTIVAGNSEGATVPGTGDYSFYLQRTNNPGGATATTFGTTSNGTLASPAQMDTFTVSATAGDRMLARMVNTGGSNSYYPDLQVYRPDGTKDCADAGITYHYLELQACLLDQAGTYTIVAGNSEGATVPGVGDYSFYLQRTNNPGGAVVSPAPDAPWPGTLSTAAQMDTYQFGDVAGDQIRAQMDTTSGSTMPEIIIYRPDGTVLCTGSTSTHTLDYTCPTETDFTGTVTVLAGNSAIVSAEGTGSYDLTLSWSSSQMGSESSCDTNGFHWYARATSGSGNNVLGTAAYTYTWSSWSVDHTQAGGAGAFSNEAQWLATKDDLSSALEVGFYSGFGLGEVYWTDAMLPYSTASNGYGEVNYIDHPLTPDTYILIEVATWDPDVPGSSSFMIVGDFYTEIYSGSYVVNIPRENSAQAEIGNSAEPTSWMGGGSGEVLSERWVDSTGALNFWGSHNDCRNSPYWVSPGGPYLWANGGYGQ